MDQFTRNHLHAWIEHHAPVRAGTDEADALEARMVALVEADPEVINSVGWTQIYESMQPAPKSDAHQWKVRV